MKPFVNNSIILPLIVIFSSSIFIHTILNQQLELIMVLLRLELKHNALEIDLSYNCCDLQTILEIKAINSNFTSN